MIRCYDALVKELVTYEVESMTSLAVLGFDSVAFHLNDNSAGCKSPKRYSTVRTLNA